jgi:hypothetical protein
MWKIRSKLSFANVMSVIAVFIALGGGAYAVTKAPKNSVTSTSIKNGGVKTKDLAKNAVVSSKIKNGQVSSGDVAPAEGFHLVGQPGEPAFGNGGQGDCLWSNFSDPTIAPPGTFNPVSFYKDPYGRVHLNGAAEQNAGTGGDTNCSEDDDSYMFTLPPRYRPAHVELLPPAHLSNVILVGATTDQSFGSILVPAGVVAAITSASSIGLDGLDFRAVGPGNSLRKATRATPARRAQGSQGLGSAIEKLP